MTDLPRLRKSKGPLRAPHDGHDAMLQPIESTLSKDKDTQPAGGSGFPASALGRSSRCRSAVTRNDEVNVAVASGHQGGFPSASPLRSTHPGPEAVFVFTG
jgi:hypothetical protein